MFNQEEDYGYLVFKGTLILNNKSYTDMFSRYLLDDGFTEEDLNIIKQYSEFINKKRNGIEYKGTLISFTKDDADGINNIYITITNDKVNVNETNFITSLGTTINLSRDNIDEFYNWFCINRNKFFITYEDFKLGVINGIK